MHKTCLVQSTVVRGGLAQGCDDDGDGVVVVDRLSTAPYQDGNSTKTVTHTLTHTLTHTETLSLSHTHTL